MADAFSVLTALGPSSSGFRLSRLSRPVLQARSLRRYSRYKPRTRGCRVACAGVPAGSGFHIADSLVIHHSYVQFLPNRTWRKKGLGICPRPSRTQILVGISNRSPTGTIAQNARLEQPHSSATTATMAVRAERKLLNHAPN